LQNASEKAHLLLVGDETILNDGLKKYHFRKDLITIVHAPEVIEMHEHPTKALKEKPQSSIGVGFFQLATGKADAFISAGNTGAMMVGSLFTIKAIDGILRPTIGGYLPRENGSLGLLVNV
jgi:glycerol-3-phosphate acyltransferase PlsX